MILLAFPTLMIPSDCEAHGLELLKALLGDFSEATALH